jgi:hypothetical protein
MLHRLHSPCRYLLLWFGRNDSNQTAHRTGCITMPVAQQDSAKRGTDIHPLKSGCQVSPPPDGESGQIEVGVLVPLVLVMNVILATVAWYVVDFFSR